MNPIYHHDPKQFVSYIHLHPGRICDKRTYPLLVPITLSQAEAFGSQLCCRHLPACPRHLRRRSGRRTKRRSKRRTKALVKPILDRRICLTFQIAVNLQKAFQYLLILWFYGFTSDLALRVSVNGAIICAK